MAGDWIKIRADLSEDVDVLRLSDILGTDDPTTVGLLVLFWSWVDRQTTNGEGIKVSRERLDKLVGRHGFSDGMLIIGWLGGECGNLYVPNFERHNGNSAKARALESEAKRLRRMSDKLSDTTSAKKPGNVGPEKRREEKNIEREINAGATGIRRPTLDQAKSAAMTIGVMAAMADEWWHAREASEWMKGAGGGAVVAVGTNWQADLKSYSNRMAKPSKPHRQGEFPEPEMQLPDLPDA